MQPNTIRLSTLFLFVLALGCTDSTTPTPAAKKVVLGNMLEPFEPPTLAELDAKVTWQDRPVLDSIELLRQRQAGEPKLATVEEALRLKNDSPEANAKILSALSRLPAQPEAVDEDAELRRYLPQDIKTTNAVLMSSVYEVWVIGLMNFGLFSFDWTLKPFASADTVASWQASADGLYEKVILRDDLTWSDGTPITAHDVVFSYRLIMTKEVPVPAQRSGTDKIKWIEAYDDHTLVFFHKEALATNIWNVNFSVIPKHIYAESALEDPTLANSPHLVKYENAPISGGPYEIVKRTKGQEIVLRRRPSWYEHNGKRVRDKPPFREVTFRVITDPSVALLRTKAGDLDEMLLSAEQWRTQTNDADFYDKNTKAHGLEWTYFYFGWNCASLFFKDKRVRQAMSYAFDHEELLTTLRFGLNEACNGIFHRTSPWAPENPPAPYTQDLDKAEELLDAAGWVDSDGDGVRDKDGQRFEFTILVSNVPDRIAICNLLRENLDQIGVVCKIRPLEFAVLMQTTLDKKFQAYFAGWGAGADPDTSDNIFGTGKERNYGSYSNPEVDRLFKVGRKEFDFEKRRRHYARIHEIVYEDQPYTWLYFRNSFFAFSKKLRGYNFSPRGPYSYSPGDTALWKPKDL